MGIHLLPDSSHRILEEKTSNKHALLRYVSADGTCGFSSFFLLSRRVQARPLTPTVGRFVKSQSFLGKVSVSCTLPIAGITRCNGDSYGYVSFPSKSF